MRRKYTPEGIAIVTNKAGEEIPAIRVNLVGGKLTQEKYCPDCDTYKPFTDFATKSSSRDGLQSYCKPCYSLRGQKRTQDKQAVQASVVQEKPKTIADGLSLIATKANLIRENQQLKNNEAVLTSIISALVSRTYNGAVDLDHKEIAKAGECLIEQNENGITVVTA